MKDTDVRRELMKIRVREGRDYNSLLRLYFQERLLYRLSVAAKEHFILKGGLFLFSINGFKNRPTQDIDLMGSRFIDNEKLRQTFAEIARVECEDGISFDPASIIVEEIMDKGDFDGRRVRITGQMGAATLPLQIDIGYGDIVIPKPTTIQFPTLFEGVPVPEIVCYSIESAVAEKFHTMVVKDTWNSRMKDFYDIWYLSKTQIFDGRVLQEAISQTFACRGTEPTPDPYVFSAENIQDQQKQTWWGAFLLRLKQVPELTYADVVTHIHLFINPVWDTICSGGEFLQYWNPDILLWQETQPVRTETAAIKAE